MKIYDIFSTQVSNMRACSHWMIGISGGVDSIVLLDLAAKYIQFNKLNINLIPVHLNHTTRAGDSDKDAELCNILAKKYETKLYTEKINVPELAIAQNENFEELARRERHNLFYKTAVKLHLDKAVLLLAHHEDDQVETILMRLERSAGWRGLRGIEKTSILPVYSQQSKCVITLSRPLLSIRKSDLIDYATENRLQWREDSSNQDKKYHRNLLRHSLIPALKILNPEFKQTLFSIASEATSLCKNVTKEVSRVHYSIKATHIEFDVSSVMLLSYMGFCRLIEKMCQLLYPTILFPKNTYKLLESLYNRTVDATDIIKDLHIYRYKSKYYIYHKNINMPEINYSSQPDKFYFENNYFTIKITRKTLEGRLPEQQNSNTEFIALTHGNTTFRLGLPKVGEKFHVYGSPTIRNVSSILKKRNIPTHLRPYIPVLYAGQTPLWLVGIGLNKEVKLTDFTGEVFCLEYSAK